MNMEAVIKERQENSRMLNAVCGYTLLNFELIAKIWLKLTTYPLDRFRSYVSKNCKLGSKNYWLNCVQSTKFKFF
jgi:hypothetical protein